METVQQNGRFTLFSCKFPSNIYSILYVYINVLILGPDLSVRKFINLRLKIINFTQIQRKKKFRGKNYFLRGGKGNDFSRNKHPWYLIIYLTRVSFKLKIINLFC